MGAPGPKLTCMNTDPDDSLVSGVDHAIIAVRDLDRAVETFRRLGFTPTDRGRHPLLGTHNHLFMFGDDYLELIGVERPGPENARWREILADREGPAGVALACDDAEAAAEALAARGLPRPEVSRFARPVGLPEGPAEARFAAAYVPAAVTPVAPMFFLQHFTRDLVWRPEWRHHPNKVTSLAGLVALSDSPVATARAHAPLVGAGAIHGQSVMLGSRPLLIGGTDLVTAWGAGVPPGAARSMPRLAGIAVRVAALAATVDVLERHAVPYARAGNAVVVAPEFACGTVLKFVG